MSTMRLSPSSFVLLASVAAITAAPIAAQRFEPSLDSHWSLSTGDWAPPGLEDLLSGDLDGDGDADLVALGASNYVCRNDRRGGLGAWQNLNWYYLRRGTLADIDGDGDLDLIATPGTTRPNGTAAGPLRQYRNQAGTFVDVTFQRMPSGTWLGGPVVALDYDRDGDLDLAAGILNGTTADFLTFDNDGQGNFSVSTAVRLPASLPRLLPTFLAASDIDRDGDMDLLAGGNGQMLLRNDGAGHFVRDTTSLPNTGSLFAVLDVDRDGDTDLLGGGAWWLNNGNATGFASRLSAVNLVEHRASVADVNGDGRVDLVITRAVENVGGTMNEVLPRLWLAQPDGTHVEAPHFFPAHLVAEQAALAGNQHWVGASPVLLTDFDQDGRADLVYGGWKAHVSGNSWTVGLPPRMLLNRDGVAFRDGERRPIPMINREFQGLFAGDLDGDGHADVIAGDAYSGDRVLRGLGDGRFELAENMPGGPSRSGLLTDLDGDGDLDFVRSGFHADYWPGVPASLLLHQGTAWVPSPLPPILDDAVAFAAGDVDGDGDKDLVVGCIKGWPTGGRNQLLLNDGTGHFSDGGANRLPTERQDTAAVALRDFDGDGDLDLIELARALPTARLRLSLNDGTGTFTDVSAARLPTVASPYSLAAVDIDRDGDVDLVLNGTTLRNDGSARFTALSNAFGSFEHLFEADGPGSWTAVFPGQGSVTIGSQTHAWNPAANDVAVPIDADRDGDLDVVVGGWLYAPRYNFDSSAGVLFNLRRQLSAPRLARTGQPWELNLQAEAAGAVALSILGTALLQPRPELSPFGALGIDPNTAIVLPVVPVGTAPNPTTLALPVPRDDSLVGLTIHAQALIVPSTGLPDARLTGVVSDVITR
jgi:hypothetical protein